MSARGIKDLRVAHVCCAVAGLPSPHQWTTAEIWSVGSGWPRESTGHARWSFSYSPSPRVLHTRYLPAELSGVLCLRHVWQQACADRAALQAACASALAPNARRDACGRGMDAGARRHTARQQATGLEQRDELALGLRIPLDIALRHGEAGMAGELLHVPETAPDLRHAARRTRNEGAASRVRRTPVHLQ